MSEVVIVGIAISVWYTVLVFWSHRKLKRAIAGDFGEKSDYINVVINNVKTEVYIYPGTNGAMTLEQVYRLAFTETQSTEYGYDFEIQYKGKYHVLWYKPTDNFMNVKDGMQIKVIRGARTE